MECGNVLPLYETPNRRRFILPFELGHYFVIRHSCFVIID